ncbi:MAG TPA: YrdB family protein [Solirubrobacterales bacterium]
MRAAALAVRFLCELAMLAALAYAGFELGEGAMGWVAGVGLPALAAATWGAFVAPKARWPVSTAVRLAIEAALFGAAVVGLALAERPLLAGILGAAAAATSLVNAAGEPQ